MIAFARFHGFLTVGYGLRFRCHFHLVKYRTMLLTLTLPVAKIGQCKKSFAFCALVLWIKVALALEGFFLLPSIHPKHLHMLAISL